MLFTKMGKVFSLKKKLEKIIEKWEKIWKSPGILSVGKSTQCELVLTDVYVLREVLIHTVERNCENGIAYK